MLARWATPSGALDRRLRWGMSGRGANLMLTLEGYDLRMLLVVDDTEEEGALASERVELDEFGWLSIIAL